MEDGDQAEASQGETPLERHPQEWTESERERSEHTQWWVF